MKRFFNHVVDFVKREDGPTAVEYAVMLALIIVVCIVAITAIGTNANKTFTEVGNQLGKTAGGGGENPGYRRRSWAAGFAARMASRRRLTHGGPRQT
jgi:pilus assembly protein Flp/PilA